MKFIVQDGVRALGVKVLGVIIEGVDNNSLNHEFEIWRKGKILELVDKYQGYDIKNDEVIEGFYTLHERVGVPRRKNLPASENLIKLLIKHQDMASINKAVDIYNIISMESKLCLGAHDIDKVFGNVTLKITDGTEKFIPLGINEEKPIRAGEYSFVDDSNDVICHLDIRQVDKTKVTNDTKNILYLIIGNECNSYDELRCVAKRIVDVTVKYCGGVATILDYVSEV